MQALYYTAVVGTSVCPSVRPSDAGIVSWKSNDPQTLRRPMTTECRSVVKLNGADEYITWRQLDHPNDEDQWPHTSKTNTAHHSYDESARSTDDNTLRQWRSLAVRVPRRSGGGGGFSGRCVPAPATASAVELRNLRFRNRFADPIRFANVTILVLHFIHSICLTLMIHDRKPVFSSSAWDCCTEPAREHAKK